MELDIPEAFIQVAKCSAVDILGDGKILTGLCTSSGQLLEFVDRKVVDSLDLDREADDLMIFTSYNPIQKYYLVRCNQQLVVIKRQKPLSIIKTYENVTQVQIEDRLLLGRPQAVIWMQGDRGPTVTDFVGQLHAEVPQPVPQLTSGLSGKLHEMTLRLAKARKLLQEKRSTRIRALYQLTPHLGPTNSQPQGDEKVLAWGPPFPTQDQVTQPPLRLSQAWRRVHNSKWVIGVPVFNTSDMSVEEVRLRLQVDSGDNQELRYETRLFVWPQPDSAGAQWMEPADPGSIVCPQKAVSGHTSAVVVGVIEEPLLTKSATVTFTGSLLYTLSNPPTGIHIQDLLPLEIQFKVEELIKGTLRPFFSEDSVDGNSEADLVSMVVTDSRWLLRVSSRHNMSASLLQPEDCGLQRMPSLPPHCWVGQHTGSLAGVVVIHQQVSGPEHQLELYARDIKQVLQLVHTLSNLWKVEESRNCGASVSDCVRSLAAEMRMLHTMLQTSSQVTPDKWTEVRKQLTSLELATDMAFSAHLSS